MGDSREEIVSPGPREAFVPSSQNSLKMDSSMDHGSRSFSEGGSEGDLRKRPGSYLSMRTEQSGDEQDTLEVNDTFHDLRERSDLSSPRLVSIKSEQSMDYPFNFRNRASSNMRPEPPISSCSERSGDDQHSLEEENTNTDLRKRSSVPMRSERSVPMQRDQPMNDIPVNFGTQLRRSAMSRAKSLDFKFKKIEEKVFSLMKNELKKFKHLLSAENPACYEEDMGDEEEDQSGIREAALKITLHVLKTMNLTNMGVQLQFKMASSHQKKFKSNLKKTFQNIKEVTAKQQNSSLPNEIYTELYFAEAGCEVVNTNHEMRNIEEISRKTATEQTAISLNDIFKALPGKDKPIRTVLTQGVAGMGKTVSVQKFILDWSDGKANRDVNFMFPLPFRELNLLKEENFSLKELVHHFFTKAEGMELTSYAANKVMFIFDGLDECRLPLDFQNNERVSDVSKKSSVDVLLTNLIKGNLLPSALIWITSRPAACGQIPPECVDLVTEVRGFSDLQKEEYFRKRFSDQSLADRIITHMKSSRSLYIMCHLPVFCWVAGNVLERLLNESNSRAIPKTLTQMFTHFLIFQITHWSEKYEGPGFHPDTVQESILALGKLAFQQLEKGNVIFYEEDLIECGVDVTEVAVHSGLCTQIFREEIGIHSGKVFSFVHLSIQEFLAAVYVIVSFSTNRKGFEKENPGLVKSTRKTTMSDLLKNAVDKTLQSENGHLDLFLRFLLGLSLESNQSLFQGLLMPTGNNTHKEETVQYIKKRIRDITSLEKSINLFHCLNELNDHSLKQEVQMYLNRSGKNLLTTATVSPALWSALVFVLLNSEEKLEEFNLSNYDPSEECFVKLLPVVKASRKAILSGCNLTMKSCTALVAALSVSSSSLRELDLSTNDIWDMGVKMLSAGLEDSHCKLETLKLCGCRLTEKSCLTLAFTLSSQVSCLKQLSLDNNNLQDSGVKLLCEGLENSQCKLEMLGLFNCNITHEGCAALASALKLNPSHLRNLNLGMNQIGDSGVKHLSSVLKEPHSKLEKLELCDCGLTEEGCTALASTLKSNSSQLRELQLKHSEAGDSGLKQLSALQEDPHCKLEILQFIP